MIRVFILVFLLMFPASSVFAQVATLALPPAAQELFDKGLIAARIPDYPQAIGNFEEARKVAGDAPVLLYNLGLAESKIPGRELRAIAWFGAYLAVNPNAPNRTAIKDQIDALDVKTQINVEHLIDTLKEMLAKLPENFQDIANTRIAALYAGVGKDDEAAQLLASEYAKNFNDNEYKGNNRSVTELVINEFQAAGGVNSAQAQAWLLRLSRIDPEAANTLQGKLAEAQTAAVKMTEARKKMSAEERVKEWTNDLDSNFFSLYMVYDTIFPGLDAPFFLDLSGYLKFLSEGGQPPSDYNPYGNVPPQVSIFYGVQGLAEEILIKHNDVQMKIAEQLKQ
jgi:hypothetical protein